MRSRAFFLVFAILSLGAGHALTPAAEPAFRRVMHAVNDEHALGRDIVVEGISIDPIDARLMVRTDRVHPPVTVHLAPGDEDPAGTHTRWFMVTTDPGASLPPTVLSGLVRILDASFPDDPFVSTGTAPRSAHPFERRVDTMRDAVRVELAHSPGDDEYVGWWWMAGAVAVLVLAMAATAVSVVRDD